MKQHFKQRSGGVSEGSLRRRFRYGRIIVSGLCVAILLSLCVMISGCKERLDGSVGTFRTPDPEGGDDYIMEEVEMDNAHFQGVGSVSLEPSLSYWLKRGDQVAVRWDTFEFHWERENKTCAFLPDDNTPISPNGDCLVCDLCSQTNTNGRPCNGTDFAGWADTIDDGFVWVVADSGFMPTENPTTVYSFAQIGGNSKILGACTNRTPTVPVFSPETSGLYRVSSLHEKVFPRGVAEGRVKILVLDDASPSQKTSYKMETFTDAANPSSVFYKWSMTGDPFWEDNFSPNLRVTKVRIVKGTLTIDVPTGRLKLDELTEDPQHPSRVVLIPAFDPTTSVFANDSNRCFADSGGDGDIDLSRCRRASGVDCNNPNDPTCRLPVTPTYLHTQAADKLTWFAEFNPGEGGVAPTLADGQVLVIEFTIERV